MGHILIVDDEPHLLELLATFLRRLGYEVTACDDSKSALGLFQQSPETYALVVLDMRMPGISGQELASQLLEINPSVHLILSSGYPFDAMSVQAPDADRVTFLQKPYTAKDLAGAIRILMAHRRASAQSPEEFGWKEG